MTTKEAWHQTIQQKGIEKTLGIAGNTLYYLRSRAKAGIFPTINAMEDHLQKAGWKVVQEKEWDKIKLSIKKEYFK